MGPELGDFSTESKADSSTAQVQILSSAMEAPPSSESSSMPPRTTFMLVLLAISVALFLSALELTSVSTALPTIVDSIKEFPSSDFIWVGSCYSLAAAAFLPMSGAFAQIFGRRPIMLAALVLFSIGSAVCGAAHNRSAFLAGRTIQGMGGGGIIALTNLILADLVPLHQRGKYNAFIGLTWSIASAIGPIVGGSLAQRGAWRWLFYMNLPLCAVVALLIMLFLRLKSPQDTLREKVAKIDWIGNFLIVACTTSSVIGLTWGGVVYSWASAHVLVPLCLGFGGMALVLVYEGYIAREPTIPISLLSNRTSLSGYIQTSLIQCLVIAFVYYLPVYFQACKLASPTSSGVDMLGIALSLAPISVIVGFTIAIYQCYRPQLWIGWAMMMVSTGLLSTLKASSALWKAIGYCIFAGSAMGTTYTATVFPVLAPLPVSANAHAISLAMFLRIFGQVWGVTIGGAIVQNGLRNSLPADVLAQISSSGDIAYSTISIIKDIPIDLRAQVQNAFADAMSNFWRAMIAISGVGFLASLVMADVPMHVHTDKNWGVEEKEKTPEAA